MAKLVYDENGRLLFTKEMKQEYTILMPQMLPIHFGMFRKLKDDYPHSNVVAIDYDPSATKINQENRIKLMLANAKGLTHQESPAPRAPQPEVAPKLAHAHS